MEKRTVLALVLVVAVLILTPRLFPGRNVPSAPTPATSATTTQPAVDSTPTALSERPPVQPPGTQVPSPAAAPAVGAGQVAAVENPRGVFRFSSAGATLESVTLRDFKNLRTKNGEPVELASAVGPLLEYRVVAGRDTIPLRNILFSGGPAAGADRNTLSYTASVRGGLVSLQYRVVPDSFLVHVTGSISGSDSLGEVKYMIIALPKNLRSNEADSLDDERHLAVAYRPKGASAKSIGFGSPDPGERELVNGPFAWVVAKNKYFLLGLLSSDRDSTLAELSVTGAPRTSKTATQAFSDVVAKVNGGTFTFDVYAGPQQWQRLRALGRDFENVNPYGGFLQVVVQPFATIVMQILLWMRANLHISYGWVLIIFGIAVRIVLWPLNQKGMRASMKMQRIQPELNEIQKRYKSDPQKLQGEMMRVYKEHDMSPFSTFTGCLPLLLPLPILFALFYVFGNTIEFRGVSFLWFPDISQKDPYYIIPLLMGVSMFVLSWIGMRNTPPNPQTKTMAYLMPVMMVFLFANFASGLNMYYTVQNLASLPQQWLIANERARHQSARKT
jgi:YidC/Oxa1 family membrane protein insertase